MVADQDRHREGHVSTEASKAPPRSLSPAAERMRRHRKRRRNGLRCLRIVLRETEIDTLVRKGFLAHASRHDPVAVRRAVHKFLMRALENAAWAA